MKLIPLSFSRLARYQGCPYRCKHEPYGGGPEAAVGDTVHQAIAAFLKTRDPLEARRVIDREVLNHRLTQEQAADCTKLFQTFGSKPWYQPDADRIITVESDDGEMEEHGRTMFCVPLPLKVDTEDGPVQIALKGAMDLVFSARDGEGIEITDWKTGFKDADPFQSDLYALASYLKYWKTTPIRVRFAYLRKGFDSREDYTDADMPGILQYVSIIAAAYVRETAWEPKFGQNCASCTFRLTCSAYLEAISKAPERPQLDPENFDALAKWAKHLAAVKSCAEKFHDEAAGLMKAYLQKHEKAAMPDGREAFLREQVGRYNYADITIQKTFADLNIPWNAGYSFSMSGFEAWAQDAMITGKITKDAYEQAVARMKGSREAVKIQKIAYRKA